MIGLLRTHPSTLPLFGSALSFVLLLDQKCLVSLLFGPAYDGAGKEEKDQAERVISATRLDERITTLAPVVYQRGGLPRPFGENSSWERLGA